MRLKSFKFVALLLFFIFAFSGIAIAGGLSSTFVEVRLKGIKPGVVYSVEREAGMPLIVNNTTEAMTIDIGVDTEKPVDYNLVPGYEAIPDLSWVVVKKKFFKDVSPGQSAKTDILIKVPRGKKYAGKKYQVYIYSHTAGNEMIRMGLMGRILIETEKR